MEKWNWRPRFASSSQRPRKRWAERGEETVAVDGALVGFAGEEHGDNELSGVVAKHDSAQQRLVEFGERGTSPAIGNMKS